VRRLTAEDRARLGIHSGEPATGAEERLEALIAAQQDTAAALRDLAAALRPAPAEEPAPDEEPRPVELREPEPARKARARKPAPKEG
jgi:hypothetical protein